MRIEIRTFATLRRYLPELGIGEPKIMEVEPGTTMDEIREMLGLPADEVKIIMRNNLHVEPNVIVENGDRITYIPAVAGG